MKDDDEHEMDIFIRPPRELDDIPDSCIGADGSTSGQLFPIG